MFEHEKTQDEDEDFSKDLNDFFF